MSKRSTKNNLFNYLIINILSLIIYIITTYKICYPPPPLIGSLLYIHLTSPEIFFGIFWAKFWSISELRFFRSSVFGLNFVVFWAFGSYALHKWHFLHQLFCFYFKFFVEGVILKLVLTC